MKEFKYWPSKKNTSSIITIESIEGKKYSLVLNTKSDMIGLSRKDKTLNIRFTSFTKISTMIEHIENQIRERVKGI